MGTDIRMTYLEESTRKIAPTLDILNFVEARAIRNYHYSRVAPWVITRAESRVHLGKFFVMFHHGHDMKVLNVDFMFGGLTRIIMFHGRYALVEVKTEPMDGTSPTFRNYWIDQDYLHIPSSYLSLAAENPKPFDRSYLQIDRFI
jgi:hypothetical protein